MNFLAPSAFLFALAIPVVVIFYLLKRKRVIRLVPSTLLWQKFLAETQASAPFQKLRRNWLLLLQILVLVLAVLAITRPYFSGKTMGGRLQVVILDASASMQSTDESPSRFEVARSQALQMVNALHDNDQMVVLQASGHTEVKQSPTSEKAALRRALQSCRVTDTPTRLQEALKLAETLIQNQQRAEIHLFSDGAVGNLDAFENSGLPLSYHRVGRGGNNLGITTLDVRPNPENAEQRAIFTSIVNYSTNARESSIELRLNGQLLETKSVKAGPRETVPQVFIASQSEDTSVFTVRLSGKDDLPADNEASVVSVLPAPVKVLLVTAGNTFLQKALRAAPHVQLTVAAALSEPAPNYDLVVLDNLAPAVWPTVNVLAFRVSATNWFDTAQRLEAPPIVGIRNSHPLLRFVSLDNVQVSAAQGVKTPGWATALVDAPQSPLLLAGELGRQRVVWVAFDVLESSWPLRISFPIFVANAVEWLNPASINASQLTIQTGKPFRWLLPPNIPTAEITKPDGATRTWNVNATTGELVFGDTFQQGIYQVKAGTNQMSFCANLLDAAESDITPKEELKLGKYAQATATRLRPASVELWRWLAAFGLVVLMGEWWYYHRRTV